LLFVADGKYLLLVRADHSCKDRRMCRVCEYANVQMCKCFGLK
jgi:hypothetical protein